MRILLKTQERIEKILGLKVNILNKKNNSGKITIEYKDLDQFELISIYLLRISKITNIYN